MLFLKVVLPLLSLFVGISSAQSAADTVEDKCTGAGRRLAAFKDKGCECQTRTFIAMDGGVACVDIAPPNSAATCINLGPGKSKCDYRCLEGYTRDKKECVKAADPEPEPETLSVDCPDPFVVSYASPSAVCGCAASAAMAKKRRTDAVPCPPPPANGKAGCKNTGKASSKCAIICDAGYKLTDDGKNCVRDKKDTTKSELDCSADAGSVGFLSADPVLGCICLPTKTDKFCGVAVGDPDAEQMCSDTTDKTGKREVKCTVKCSEGFVAKDPSSCEEEIEGDSMTMAGTATPRDSDQVACSSPDKIFKLPGKGGCKCAASAPKGATECPGVGPLEYAICQYEKGSGDEASCATECIRGKFKKGSPPTCK